MREYKFRVWNDFIKKYKTLQEVASRGAIMLRGNELKTTVNYPLIIEQFTGLHDKNGVEIYEGDILSDGDLSTRVHWDYTEAGFTNGVCDWRKLLPHLEVIGNIHEEVVE